MVLYLQKITMSGTTAEISPAAVIDNFESLIWVRRYDTPGDFELYMPADKDIFALIKANLGYLILTREDSQDVMYAEYVKLTENEESGDYILLKGRSIDCVMERRVIGYPTTYTHYPRAVVIGNLINENMISPTAHTGYPRDELHRTLAPFTFDRGTFTGSAIERIFNGENLLEAVGGLLKDGDYGLRNKLVNGGIVLELYQGQERPYVRFSPDNQNLLSSEYECDIRGQCNTAFVYAEGDEEHIKANGTNPYTVTQQYPVSQGAQKSNYMRYEGFMAGTADTRVTESESVTEWVQGAYTADTGTPTPSANTVRCEIDYDSGVKISAAWDTTATTATGTRCYAFFYDSSGNYLSLSEIANGNTITPPANAKKLRLEVGNGGYTITPSEITSFTLTALRGRVLADYKAAVAEQGAALINTVTDSIKGETIETGLYTIGTDYDLGDTVHVENSYGISGTARVSETTERFDAEGYHIYPTFTDWTVTT